MLEIYTWPPKHYRIVELKYYATFHSKNVYNFIAFSLADLGSGARRCPLWIAFSVIETHKRGNLKVQTNLPSSPQSHLLHFISRFPWTKSRLRHDGDREDQKSQEKQDQEADDELEVKVGGLNLLICKLANDSLGQSSH